MTDALNPWIEVDAISEVSGEQASKVDAALVEQALDDVAQSVEHTRDEARKSHRQRRRELKRALGR